MSIEENTVLLVIDAMSGYVVIVEIAVVIKIVKRRKMRINKLTLKHTESGRLIRYSLINTYTRLTNKLVHTQG
jgi:hypothetical protein